MNRNSQDLGFLPLVIPLAKVFVTWVIPTAVSVYAMYEGYKAREARKHLDDMAAKYHDFFTSVTPEQLERIKAMTTEEEKKKSFIGQALPYAAGTLAALFVMKAISKES